MKLRITYLVFLFCMLFCACEKSTEANTSPRENFESLWRIIDENYCFFEFKDIDWDEVHDRYSPQIKDTMNQFALFEKLGEMLAELKDGHTNLISSFNMSRYWDWYEKYPKNFYKEIQENYLGTDYYIAGGLKYKRLANDQIGYVYYGSFSSGVGENNLDYMFLHFKDCQGLIFDVRDNGGGSMSYADRIASRFLEERILTGYSQYKKGNGHNDFTEPKPLYLSPSERIRWSRPVIVLTNRHSYSATNDFVNVMRLLPQVLIMGDRTGGGSGLPFSSELPNGWSVRFSACPILDINKKHTEFGIDPDVKVSITSEDILKGKDTILETAIKQLLTAVDSTKAL
ncbi:S41 family peptidase [Parabacteroides sp. AM08-6]|uniref:S41 family peptidase n=1 Tax=Parabacteroides sp. AM08-6 TaxID=2292053 RepID=UPI000EFF611D|nr:S41 family peptidase [Parabacteroides sp. AM08-6]RHJ81029.1 peptidase S41 [Parabacteroides sp. AM08-6]